ncbi:MAG: 50S ribosomal protein L31e [Nanoarchaeota archaeon]|nr:50S ribosomal protein L31e [Nanoarchaeota archaeon]
MVLERIYTIPLRKEFLKAPKYKRTKRAITAIRAFTVRHMKCDNVKIGKYLNLEMWKHGRKNPPPRIQVKAIKDKKKINDKEVEFVKVELVNAPEEKKVEKKKKSLKESLLGKALGKGEKSSEKKKEEVKEELEEKVKKEETLLEEPFKKAFTEKKALEKEEKDGLEKEKKEVLLHEKSKKIKVEKEATKDKTIKSQGLKQSKIIGRTSKK